MIKVSKSIIVFSVLLLIFAGIIGWQEFRIKDLEGHCELWYVKSLTIEATDIKRVDTRMEEIVRAHNEVAYKLASLCGSDEFTPPYMDQYVEYRIGQYVAAHMGRNSSNYLYWR